MRVLILGGNGFIGRFVATRLRDGGHDVSILHRGKTEPPPGVTALVGDRRNLADLAIAAAIKPDAIIDMIAWTEADAGPILDAFAGVASRLVLISSCDAYRNYDGLRRIGDAPPDPTPLREDSPLRERLYPYRTPETLPGDFRYAYDKIPLERACLSNEVIAATVLRLPMVYGPGDRQHRLFPYLKRMDERRPGVVLSQGQSTWRTTRGYVENVAAAIAAATLEPRAAGRVFNVGEPRADTEREWIDSVASVVGWQGRVVESPEPDADTDWRYALHTDTSALRELCPAVDPIDRVEALRRTIAWEREHPPASIDPAAFDYAAEDAVLAGDSSRA
jgi:nucleoside-diphosphate-sugar epimerase